MDGILREDSANRFVANRYRKALMCPALCDKIEMCKLSHVLLENQTQQRDTVWRNVVISFLAVFDRESFHISFCLQEAEYKAGHPISQASSMNYRTLVPVFSQKSYHIDILFSLKRQSFYMCVGHLVF